jgi:hypothetical protein
MSDPKRGAEACLASSGDLCLNREIEPDDFSKEFFMRRWLLSVALAFGVVGVVSQTPVALGLAVMVQPMQGPQRLAQADAVVVGRVVGFEPMDVQAEPMPGQPKQAYRIAVVQVSEALIGVKKDVKMIRVGFIAPPVNADGPQAGGINGNPGVIGGPINQIQIGRMPINRRGGIMYGGNQMNLDIGMDGMFIMGKHAKENFYLSPMHGMFVSSQQPNFATEVAQTKGMAKLLENPQAGLKSTDAQERYLAAALLVTKYRMPSNPNGMGYRTEKIDAEESKLILKALGEGTWNLAQQTQAIPHPFEIFGQLGVNQTHGYTPPMQIRDQNDLAKAMQTWLRDNSEKFRIEKLVPVAGGQPGVQPGIGQPAVDLPLIQPGVINRPGVVRPGIRPAVMPIKGNVQIQPGKVQILPAPAIEVNDVAVPVPQVLPAAPVQQVLPAPAGGVLPPPVREDR